MSRVGWIGAAAAATLLGTSATAVHAEMADPTAPRAEGNACRVVDVAFMPGELVGQTPMRAAPQIVVWVETAVGEYQETVFITQATGRYGIGNRPGRYDFNSGPRWPYGRRITTFPVWSHRHPEEFPSLRFQDSNDENLSHSMAQSSPDLRYCAPKLRDDPSWDAAADTGSCASVGYTDKGTFTVGTSKYPPRADLNRMPEDTVDVDSFKSMNIFDAVSHATPAEGVPATASWAIPEGLPDGDYVLWMEVSREFDQNATYSEAAYPSPVGIPYGGYGEAYRGQPSVVYKVPFTIGASDMTATTLEYAGYGDPDGLDGDLRAPDATITTGVAGSGAERLAVRADGGAPYRLRVAARTEPDAASPGAATELAAEDVTSTSAVIHFVAPGEDGTEGRATSYEIRYRVGSDITEANFADSQILGNIPVPDEPGMLQSIPLDKLLFDTDYALGIRAIDDCRKPGPLAVLRFTTAERAVGEVDACFIATAAYGSVMAADVTMLRRFRDLAMRNSVLGQLAIQSYYTFGPALSGVIAESDPLRDGIRTLLAPVVERVRGFTY